MRLCAVRLFVADLPSALDFYQVRLGLALKASSPEHGYAVFRVGDADLVVERVESSAPDEDRALVGRFTGLSLEVSDVVATCAKLEQQGVIITGQPERQFWGGTLATIQDPAANQIQLVQLPLPPAPG